MEVREWELVGALIDAADRSPIEAVKAVIGTFRDAERDVLDAVEAVGGFLRAHRG